MQKKTPDYDNVFKTMKRRHRRLFIPVINDIFGKDYPMDAGMEALATEGCLAENETADGGSIGDAVRDLEYFRDEMVRLHREGVLSDGEIVDLMGFVNTIITHITNGNQNEERRKRFREPLSCAERSEEGEYHGWNSN